MKGFDFFPISILYKSIAGRYRPVRVADGPVMTRCRFIMNASWDPNENNDQNEEKLQQKYRLRSVNIQTVLLYYYPVTNNTKFCSDTHFAIKIIHVGICKPPLLWNKVCLSDTATCARLIQQWTFTKFVNFMSVSLFGHCDSFSITYLEGFRVSYWCYNNQRLS